MSALSLLIVLSQLAAPMAICMGTSHDRQFEQLAERYLDEFPALSPVSATELGDHRFDNRLDMVGVKAQAQKQAFCCQYLEKLRKIDQAIHTEGMTRQEALRLMMEDTFQEERKAAAKWVRAQLTSTQLSTYFVGTIEHFDLRRDIQRAWDSKFDLKNYHDKILSYGSPPVQYVKALVLNKEIPYRKK
jgi:uncharacterized protein (DUF885 family)